MPCLLKMQGGKPAPHLTTDLLVRVTEATLLVFFPSVDVRQYSEKSN